MLMQPKEVFFGEEYREVTDEILVNGIIDCYFTEKDVGILIDYKSDRIYDEEDLRRDTASSWSCTGRRWREQWGFHSGDLSLFLCDGEGNSFDIRGKGSILN